MLLMTKMSVSPSLPKAHQLEALNKDKIKTAYKNHHWKSWTPRLTHSFISRDQFQTYMRQTLNQAVSRVLTQDYLASQREEKSLILRTRELKPTHWAMEPSAPILNLSPRNASSKECIPSSRRFKESTLEDWMVLKPFRYWNSDILNEKHAWACITKKPDSQQDQHTNSKRDIIVPLLKKWTCRNS